MSKNATPAPPKTAAEQRAERLAAELRANLQRRKRQTRGRDAVGEPPPPAPDGADTDD